MIKTPREVLDKWMAGVNGGDVELLLSLYDDQAVLIPTFSNRILNKKDDLKAYFEKLATKESLSIEVHEKTIITQNVQDTVYILSGNYNWRFAIDGEMFNFEARFNYTIDLSRSNPILNHHSSQIPRTL